MKVCKMYQYFNEKEKQIIWKTKVLWRQSSEGVLQFGYINEIFYTIFVLHLPGVLD